MFLAEIVYGDHGENGTWTRHGLQTFSLGALRIQSEQPGVISQDTHLLKAFLEQ